MDLPKSVKVGHVVYELHYNDKLKDGDEDLHGICQENSYIAVNPRYSTVRSTLVHEILHAIDYYLGENLSERVVTSVSNMLFAVLKDNPDVVAYLLEA